MSDLSPEALADVWEKRGPEAIATVRTHDPSAYIRAIAALVADDD